MDRTIRVKGKGKISVKPDTICLNIRVERFYKEYAETVRESADDTRRLQNILVKAGLNPEDLQTVSFSIDSENEKHCDVSDKDGKRFIGYKYIHCAEVSFPNDNAQLGRILYLLANSSVKAAFSVRHTLRDLEAIKNELLTKAVKDAKNKAYVLAEAANVALGEILTVDYSSEELEMYSESAKEVEVWESERYFGIDPSYDIDIEAEDINVEDTVTVVWEIK